MQHNEWGQNQGDKREHFRIPLQIFDMPGYEDHHHHHRKDFDCKDKCDLLLIILLRKILVQFEAAFGICVLDQVSVELLFADFDFKDVGLVNRHIPRAIKNNFEDNNM